MPKRRPCEIEADVFAGLLEGQAQMVARRQLVQAGAAESEIATMLRCGDLHLWVPGVYTTTPGLLAWQQRAWGSLLACWPAMLDRDSALRAVNGPGWRGRSDDAPIQVAVQHGRRAALRSPEFVVRRVADAPALHQPGSSPPWMRVEEATLDSCDGRDPLDVVEALSRTVRARMSTPVLLRAALDSRRRMRQRSWLEQVLDDLQTGTWSVLEHGYLTLVERPHGLLAGHRNRAVGGRYIDVDIDEVELRIELDGVMDHTGRANRDRDLARDLAAAVEERLTVRLGWTQVFRTPCDTAESLGAVMQNRGWTGSPKPCGCACGVRRSA